MCGKKKNNKIVKKESEQTVNNMHDLQTVERGTRKHLKGMRARKNIHFLVVKKDVDRHVRSACLFFDGQIHVSG